MSALPGSLAHFDVLKVCICMCVCTLCMYVCMYVRYSALLQGTGAAPPDSTRWHYCLCALQAAAYSA
jgi:hypothetical protein